MSRISQRLRRALRIFTIATVLSASAGAALILHHGRTLTSPQRRPLQDYHLDYLSRPSDHGIRIERHDCLDGKVPCLVVSPDPSAVLGKRGTLIRSQIQSPPDAHGHVVANLVLLHGRNGRKEDLLPVAERFCAVGFRCLMPDLPAHGDSPLPVSKFGLGEWERQLPERVLEECASALGFADAPAALWGISMGGSFATSSAAAAGAPWRCLVIVSSFDRLDKVVEGQCRSGTVAGLVSSVSQNSGGPELSEVTPSSWAREVTIPVLVAHGSDDRLIPIDFGRSLFAAFPSQQKRWFEVEGGTHSTVLTTPMPLYSQMADWLLKHTVADAHPDPAGAPAS